MHQDAPEIVVLDQVHPKGEGADEWHSDNTFLADPPMGSILRAVQLPAVGGDTCFASMYAAYDGAVAARCATFVDGLRAVHDITKPLQKAIRDGHSTLDLAEMQEKCPPVEHNVVGHASRDRPQGAVREPQLDHAHRRAQRPRERGAAAVPARPRALARVPVPVPLGGRARSRSGTTASVQHYAVADYHERRIMHRVTDRRARCAPVATDATTRRAYLSEPGAVGLFTRLTRVGLLVDAFQHRCLDPFGLLFIDYSVLRVLELVGPPYRMSPTELAEILLRSSGGMTQILDRLERAGLVAAHADPDDRRKVRGRAHARAACAPPTTRTRRTRASASACSPGCRRDEVEQLDAAIHRLLEVMRAEDAADRPIELERS